jgi:hypothetical protein
MESRMPFRVNASFGLFLASRPCTALNHRPGPSLISCRKVSFKIARAGSGIVGTQCRDSCKRRLHTSTLTDDSALLGINPPNAGAAPAPASPAPRPGNPLLASSRHSTARCIVPQQQHSDPVLIATGLSESIGG